METRKAAGPHKRSPEPSNDLSVYPPPPELTRAGQTAGLPLPAYGFGQESSGLHGHVNAGENAPGQRILRGRLEYRPKAGAARPAHNRHSRQQRQVEAEVPDHRACARGRSGYPHAAYLSAAA